MGVVAVFTLVTMARGTFWQTESNLYAEVVEDDACREDSQTTAAVMYFKHAQALELDDPAGALEAYATCIGHRAFPMLEDFLQATVLSKAAVVAHKLGQDPLALQWTSRAVRLGPARIDVWLIRAATTPDPHVALAAAQYAFRLEQTPATFWMLGGMRIAAQQPEGAEDIARAVALEPSKYCARLQAWLTQRPDLATGRLEALIRSCN